MGLIDWEPVQKPIPEWMKGRVGVVQDLGSDTEITFRTGLFTKVIITLTSDSYSSVRHQNIPPMRGDTAVLFPTADYSPLERRIAFYRGNDTESVAHLGVNSIILERPRFRLPYV